VAAKKDMINDYINVVREAGLQASVVDAVRELMASQKIRQ